MVLIFSGVYCFIKDYYTAPVFLIYNHLLQRLFLHLNRMKVMNVEA